MKVTILEIYTGFQFNYQKLIDAELRQLSIYFASVILFYCSHLILIYVYIRYNAISVHAFRQNSEC